jgi:hypothetical protein
MGGLGSRERVGEQPGGGDAPPDGDAWGAAGHGGHGGLEHRPPGGHGLEPLVTVSQRAAPGLRERGEHVHAQATGGRQLVEDLGELLLHLGPPARQHEVREAELVDPPAFPGLPRLSRRRRLGRVAFEDRHLVSAAGEQHGR